MWHYLTEVCCLSISKTSESLLILSPSFFDLFNKREMIRFILRSSFAFALTHPVFSRAFRIRWRWKIINSIVEAHALIKPEAVGQALYRQYSLPACLYFRRNHQLQLTAPSASQKDGSMRFSSSRTFRPWISLRKARPCRMCTDRALPFVLTL